MKLNIQSALTVSVFLAVCCWFSQAEAADTCVPPPPGLVSWWRAESNAMDAMGFNHGMNMGGVAFTAGKVGQAFSFNAAANSSLTIPNSPSLLPASGQFTIEAWIKPDFTAANVLDTIFGKRDGCNSANISYLLVIAKAGLSGSSVGEVILVMTTTGSGTVQLNSGSAHVVPADNQFHHVAATYEGAVMKIYLDGQLVGQAERTGPIAPSISPVEIGGHGGTCADRSVAAMDEVAFFDRALTAAEIQAIFNAGSAGKCADKPVFLTSSLADGAVNQPYAQTIQAGLTPGPYTFQLLSGTLPSGLTLASNGVLSGTPLVGGTSALTIRVTDSLGASAQSSYLLRIAECAQISAGLVSWWRAESNATDALGFDHGVNMGGVTFTAGQVGQAFSFNGAADSYLTISNHLGLLPASGQLTIEAWIKPDFGAANGFDTILTKRDGCSGSGISYFLGVSKAGSGVTLGALYFSMSTASGVISLTSERTVVPDDGRYHHVAGTFDGSTMRVYLDGQIGGQASRPEPIIPTTSAPVISHHGGGCPQRAVAAIDEVGFYSRALSNAELQAIFNAGGAGKCSETPYFITSLLPEGRAGSPYSTVIQAALGTPPYTFTLTSGTLADGLTLGADGVLQGNPQVAGTNTLTIRVTDNFGHSAERDFMLNIAFCPEIPSGLVAYWPFNGDTMDLVGTNHGTIEGSPYFTNGISGTGLFFSGADQVRVKHSPELSFETHDPMSVSIWVHPMDQNVGHMFGKRLPQCTGGNEINYQMVYQNSQPGVGFGPQGGTAGANRELPLGTWTHLAATFDGTTMKFYFNGIEAGIDTTRFLGPTNQYDLLIGASGLSGPGICIRFRGILDEFAIYRRALSADEITALFTNQGRPPLAPPPVITCPSNIVANTDPGQCSKSNVTYTATATDNCPAVIVTCSPPSGSAFPKGVTTVTCMATDISGNTNACSFTVTVRDLEPPQFTCQSNIVMNGSFENGSFTPDGNGFVSLLPGSTAMAGWTTFSGELVWSTVPNAGNWPASHGNYFLDLTGYHDSSPYGGVQQTLTTVSGTTYRVTFDLSVNQSVPNSRGPITVRVGATGAPSQEFTQDPPGSGIQWGHFAYDFDATGPSTDLSFLGISTAGGKAIGLDNVSVEPRQIACQSNIVTNTDPGQCSKSNVTYTITATDNCPGVTVMCDPASGSTFPKGVSTVTCIATDASGNTNSYSFTVTVRDLELPQINCPSNIVVNTDAGQCSKSNVTYTATATDNCLGPTVMCSPASGSTFAKGVTTVTCVATDTSANTNSCSFTVTVADATPPVITCPSNLTTICNVRTGAVVNFTVTATDECDPGVSVVSTPPSGSAFPFGTTTVNCTATDASGRAANCSFTVTVLEPLLRAALDANKIVVTWAGNGTLQYTDELLGDGPPTVWIDVPDNPLSPYAVAPSAAKRFYRVSGCHD